MNTDFENSIKKNTPPEFIPYPRFYREKSAINIELKSTENLFNEVKNKAAELGYKPKDLLHITIVAPGQGKAMKKHIEETAVSPDETLRAIKNLVENFSFQIEPKMEYYHLSKEYSLDGQPDELRESIVAIMHIANIDTFWEKLQEISQFPMTKPFPHVTLATKGSNPKTSEAGIGIKSEDDFTAMKKEKFEI